MEPLYFGPRGRLFGLRSEAKAPPRRTAVLICHSWGVEYMRSYRALYLLAQHATTKRKYMYVLDTTHPLKFLQGGRSLSSVMSRNRKLWEEFQASYGSQFSSVGDYYSARGGGVALVSVSGILAELSAEAGSDANDGATPTDSA